MSRPENYKEREHDYNLRPRGFGSPSVRTTNNDDDSVEDDSLARLESQLQEVQGRATQREAEYERELERQRHINETLQQQLSSLRSTSQPVATNTPVGTTATTNLSTQKPIGNVKLQLFDGKSQSPIQWWTLFLQYCSLLGRPDTDIVRYFPFHLSQQVADWYGTLEEATKTNLIRLREAFFQRYRRNHIEYTLTDIKQTNTESTDDFINRVIRETRDSGVPENILVGMMAGGLRPDLAGIVMPQTPRTIQQLRSIATVAQKTIAVTNNKPIEQLSAQVSNLTQMEDRLMEALSNKLSAAVQTMSTSKNHNQRFYHRGTEHSRRPACNYCGRYCLNRESCPARFAICRFCNRKGHFENVCRSAKRNQNISTQNQHKHFQR